MKIRFLYFLIFSVFVSAEANAGVRTSFEEHDIIKQGSSFIDRGMEHQDKNKSVGARSVKNKGVKVVGENADNEQEKIEDENVLSKVVADDSKSEGEDEEEKTLLEKRREQLAIERAKVTNRFKKKAIKNTERREKRHEELLKEKEERESRFQKKAREEEEKRIKQEKEREKNEIKSRFQQKAEKKAEERSKRKEEREKKLKRNK